LGFVFFEGWTKVGHVIREGEDESDDILLVELNSNFEFANMQWNPKIVVFESWLI
jgi:hypothetical protein